MAFSSDSDNCRLITKHWQKDSQTWKVQTVWWLKHLVMKSQGKRLSFKTNWNSSHGLNKPQRAVLLWFSSFAMPVTVCGANGPGPRMQRVPTQRGTEGPGPSARSHGALDKSSSPSLSPRWGSKAWKSSPLSSSQSSLGSRAELYLLTRTVLPYPLIELLFRVRAEHSHFHSFIHFFVFFSILVYHRI